MWPKLALNEKTMALPQQRVTMATETQQGCDTSAHFRIHQRLPPISSNLSSLIGNIQRHASINPKTGTWEAFQRLWTSMAAAADQTLHARGVKGRSMSLSVQNWNAFTLWSRLMFEKPGKRLSLNGIPSLWAFLLVPEFILDDSDWHKCNVARFTQAMT
jgi:hypothetical protein